MSEKVSVQVPRLGLSVVEVKLLEWTTPDGQPVSHGDIICLVETDKATNEIEAPASGRLRHSAAIDQVCEVGATIGFIESDD